MRALVLGVLVGCATPAPYLCVSDADCGPSGHCEADSLCSVDDATCESGRRYTSAAGEVASSCTDNSLPPVTSEDALCGVTAITPDPTGTCASAVCASDPACCTVGWDEQCARAAQARCELGCDLAIAAGGFTTGEVFRVDDVTTSLFPINHDHWNYATAWGDLDGDGNADLAVARNVGTDGTDGVVIFQSSGLANGKLVMTPVTIAGAIGTVETLEWRDFDADGDLDLLASGTSGIYLVVTEGTSFVSHQLLAVGATAVWLDRDGQAPWRIGTLLQNVSSSELAIRDVTLDGASYTMSPGSPLGTQEFAYLAYCNVAGTPDRDLIAGDRLFIANATGFASAMPLGANGFYPECADLDGDGDNDLVLGSYDKASLILNEAGPASIPLVVPAISVGGIAVGDFDHNGRVDVLLSNNTNTRAEIPLILIESKPAGFTTRELPDWNTADFDSSGISAGPLPRP